MHVWYHGNCPDGFGAALAVWMKHPGYEFEPVFHNTEPPEVKHKKIIMLDFCYPLKDMLKLLDKVDEILIVDHHEGISPTIEKLKKHPKVKMVFDTKHSGAHLAWKCFHPNCKVPRLFNMIEDRDCHFNQMENDKPCLLWLDTQPFVFPLWETFAKFKEEIWDKIRDYNKPMLKKFNSMVRKAAAQHAKTKIGGFDAGICFGTEETASDIATEIAKIVKGIGIVVVVQKNGKMKASLRRFDKSVDLSKVAQCLGGNGHPYAAAFPCSVDDLKEMLVGTDILKV